MSFSNDYINGYIERKVEGRCEGIISIDNVNLSPIEGTYFEQDGDKYLWLKRKPIMEYDFETQSYKTRHREPRWECYLKKDIDTYRGEFAFLRFRYSIVGIWDKVIGLDKGRMNFFVERLPMNEQTILNGINERKRNAKRQ